MGQDAHRKYKEFKNAEEKLKSWSSNEDRQAVRIKELEYKIQQKEDDEDYNKALDFFDKYGDD